MKPSALRRPAHLIVLYGVLVAAFLVPVVPAPASSQTFPSFCPAMTDSITRLYWAYYGRQPDTNGFNHWVDVYRSGEKGLEDISQEMAEGFEFTSYGYDTDQEFVDWVYASELGVDTDRIGRQYWLDALRDGYPRGSMVLTFSESR